ncbi:MAG TPA: MTAP family purine nucleoside phosphorylase [Solirubrobacterales bacterium]
MPPVGVILGSSATGPRADLAAAVAGLGAVTIQRHAGGEGYTLPHHIDHAANVRALLEAGCEAAIAICSVGSLRDEIEVGALVCPDDFIALSDPITTFDDARAHRPPGLDPDWRGRLVAAAASAGVGDGGVYWQVTGPRFETPAEIRMISPHAHVVGMTMASECVVAGELGLPYAAICAVDNMANGIGPGPLGIEEMEAVREENAGRLQAALETILPALGTKGTA